METSDELTALEFDFRRTLIAELKRVVQHEDSEFFAINQPQYEMADHRSRNLLTKSSSSAPR